MVELENSQQQVKRKGGVGLQLFVQNEVDFIFRDAGDLGAVEEASGDDVEYLAGLGAQDAREVDGLISCESGGGISPGIGDEAAASHLVSKLVETALLSNGMAMGNAPS